MENNNQQAPGTHMIVSKELADALQPLTNTPEIVLDGKIVNFQKENSGSGSYISEEALGEVTPQIEMTPEEQQAILRQIIQGTKNKGLNMFKKISKTVSVDADKKRKAKNKAAKKSRKSNHKKKK